MLISRFHHIIISSYQTCDVWLIAILNKGPRSASNNLCKVECIHDIQNFKYFFPISEKKTFNKKWLLFPVENDEKDRKSAISNINFNRYVERNVNVKFPLKLTLPAHWSPAHDKPNIMFPKNTVPEKFPLKICCFVKQYLPSWLSV